ncbi:MAG: glycosyltransferase [bacterium]|nr:glycosyltransferase [bacterium]
MTVSIIIPVYNRVDLTRVCLEHLYKNTSANIFFEVIVVDNGSSDGTAEFLTLTARQYPNLNVITNRDNSGFSIACNQGAEQSIGKYLLFLNNDTQPQEGWLSPLVETLDMNPPVGAVSGKLLFPDGTIQHAGVVTVKDPRFPNPPGTIHIYYRQPGDLEVASHPRYYQILTAACLMVRPELFHEAGGFDTGYQNGYEDVDFCLKVGQSGAKLVYTPSCRVIHHEFGSGWKRFESGSANLKRFREKWGERLVPDFIRGSDSVFRLNPKSPLAASYPPELGKILRMEYFPPSFLSAELFLQAERARVANIRSWKSYYRRALRLISTMEKKTGQDLYRMASIYKRLELYSVSAKYFKEVIHATGDTILQSGAYFHLGEIEMSHGKGNTGEAKKMFEEALTLNPLHQKAREYLNEI